MTEIDRIPHRADVEQRLATLIGEIAKIPPDRIVPGATIDEELRMESVAFIELQVAIEDEYNIELDPIRVVELNELSAIIDYVYDCVVSARS
jgi:acyl carrier protein